MNEFRRNTYNEEVKVKLSKHNLNKNGNIKKFELIELSNEKINEFDNLVDAANYLIDNGFEIVQEDANDYLSAEINIHFKRK